MKQGTKEVFEPAFLILLGSGHENLLIDYIFSLTFYYTLTPYTVHPTLLQSQVSKPVFTGFKNILNSVWGSKQSCYHGKRNQNKKIAHLARYYSVRESVGEVSS